MTYFAESYSSFAFVLKQGDAPGFRLPQVGALHAVAAHFTQRTEPAMVIMPTGAGKTAVLQGTCYLLRCKRALVITPSRLVREQIAEGFRSLDVLKRIGAIPEDFRTPRVHAVDQRLSSEEDWRNLEDYDVVVATASSASPAIEGVSEPPKDLFDLLLVDEAHHAPAATWSALLEYFDQAKRVMFTATPFRRDERELKGRIVYTYHMRQARADGIFGEISYEPVVALDAGSEDKAIATAAAAKLKQDHAAGFKHKLLVRTDSRKRASELEEIYAAETDLKLACIRGDHTLGYVKRTIKKLREDELDGIICVNMLGEGFDFPNLKVAAIHAPHRSLAVTLQFIGRFARTAGDNLGSATFFAAPSEVEVEAKRLYAAGATWQDLVPSLSEDRVMKEEHTREVLSSFEDNIGTDVDNNPLSLYALTPYSHAKIFTTRAVPDLSMQIDFPYGFNVAHFHYSAEHDTAVYVVEQRTSASWTDEDRFANVAYDLFILFYSPAAQILFICASRRVEGLYSHVSREVCGYPPRPLPLPRLNRALANLDDARFFNVGMRSRSPMSLTESYRVLVGANASSAIQSSDARQYHRGHCFGKAKDGGQEVTIGISSAAKVWSNTTRRLPELITWFKHLAGKIALNNAVVTNSGLDYLSAGEEVSEIPDGIVFADWDRPVYMSGLRAAHDVVGNKTFFPLTDLELSVEKGRTHMDQVGLLVSGNGLQWRADFRIDRAPHFTLASAAEPTILVLDGRDEIPLLDFLNDVPPHFFTWNLGRLHGDCWYAANPAVRASYDAELIDVVDWNGAGVEIISECAPCKDATKISIQDYLGNSLRASAADVVYFDHGTGEMADYIAFTREADRILVALHHCKGAGGAAPGNRVDDVYEVCGQAVKSAVWADRARIFEQISSRHRRGKGGAQFVRGDVPTLQTLLADPLPLFFEMVVVQPGITKAGIDADLSEVLGSAGDYLAGAGNMRLRVMGSA